jgi:putative transposase
VIGDVGYASFMARTARHAPGGFIYHVLNRGVGRAKLFRSRNDHLAFQSCLTETQLIAPMRILTYCVMPNHWHLLLWPKDDGELARFMMRLTNRHVRRWLTAHQQVGTGHLYQGRFKSFACQNGPHLLTVARYIDRNARRANLVERCQDWPWSGAGQAALDEKHRVELAGFPVDRGEDWLDYVNKPQTAVEEDSIRESIKTSKPYGSERWLKMNQQKLGWTEPGRPGRPRKRT